jgi:VWFA-related protein
VAFEVHIAAPMRIAVAFLAVLPLAAQFKSTVPLVVSPVTVTDGHGHFIDGLTAKDLALYDNNVPQPVQMDIAIHPISLVVAVEANSASIAMLDKLGRSGSLFTDLLSGYAGETALVTFSDRVTVAQDFTADSTKLNQVLRGLRAQGDGAAVTDAIAESLRLLATRAPGRRRVILAIAESRDRSSALKIDGLMRRAELQNTAVYWLTYSTLLVPFTNQRKTKWDRMTDEQKQDPLRMHSSKLPTKDEEEPLPMDMAPGSLIQIFTELAHKQKVNAAELLTRTTGGRTFSFLKQSGLESAIQAVGAEVHRQYIVNFQPKPDVAGVFHRIRVEVRGRPELQVRAREGYWSVE